MPNIFPSREELMQLPLNKLRTIDVKDRFEEELLQAVINLKTEQQPPQTPIKTSDVPDIYNSTDEAKWQKILDDRRAGLKPQVEVKSDASGIEIKVASIEGSGVVGGESKIDKVVETTAFKCEQCGKISKTDKLLKMHKGRFHKVAK
jgi:hypothetical protein